MAGILGNLSDQDLLMLLALQQQFGNLRQNAYTNWPPEFGPQPPGTEQMLPPEPLPPTPDRNPRRAAVEALIRDAAPDSDIISSEMQQGHTAPMYSQEEYQQPRGRKQRKGV